jgi:predicted KAP-like P-loop ATPase
VNDISHNDQPISKPGEDRFGIDPFAAALAKSILKIKSPRGSVIALNGPWGSGKSSALNLIKHHLDDAVETGEITIIEFACWWFRGEEALALAFFRELYAGLSPTLGEKLKKSLPKLGARLLKAGGVLGSAADLAGAGGVGGAVGGTVEWLGGLIQQDESVEKLHADLSMTLEE